MSFWEESQVGNFIFWKLKEGAEAVINLCQNGACVFAFGGAIENTFSNLSSRVLKNY